MSLKPLLNAAVFQQLSMWQFVSYSSNAPLGILAYKFLSSSSKLYFLLLVHLCRWLRLRSAKCCANGQNTDPQKTGNEKLGDDHFGITVLLEYM